jgi:Zn-finger nucleic acid-binding protein
MECPRCNVEMVELTEGEDRLLAHCGECDGLWLDVADLNRILLHSNLPTLEAMEGRADPEEDANLCPVDNVNMLVVLSKHKRDPRAYETCEVCGGIWLEGADFDVEGNGKDQLRQGIIHFFRDYSGRAEVKAQR